MIESRILPTPATPQENIIIVSTSSNRGIIEGELASQLGPQYKIVAGDITNISREANKASPVRLDALFLPFIDNSIDVIIDILGAAWYEANFDLLNPALRGLNTKKLFLEYRNKLSDRGMVIIDESPNITPIATGELINQALELADIDGFKTPVITGKKPYQFRVYYKA